MQMTDMPMAMALGMGVIWMLVIIFLLLGIAASSSIYALSGGIGSSAGCGLPDSPIACALKPGKRRD